MSSSFYICLCSLLIKTRLVFISYFVSVPLRKGYRGLEYQCSFVSLYPFLFAFLIICIKTFGFCRLFCVLFAFLIICIKTFGLRRLFCNNCNTKSLMNLAISLPSCCGSLYFYISSNLSFSKCTPRAHSDGFMMFRLLHFSLYKLHQRYCKIQNE